ncbi:hypothetical protein [Polaribacter glomeratus]|uniref:Lipoprotein n=1 Tax=Polaribacter glomeratus TaxID=102 RepID=A0A2S7WUK9_9FLAO|nr:hypothetical protein [Polaribacter glomeratus]PQJ81265.1 hypothetical protein BTO16_01105 [Polaribacter glomeratus]TXD65820.1 hypothetical protein ESX12_09370 [Polaribacter glomeratus]
MKNLFGILLSTILLFTSCGINKGIVKGSLCYPSDYIPEMNVYLKNMDNNKIYLTDTKQGQKTFRFKKIVSGNYVAYAYTKDSIAMELNGNSLKASGGFTKAVDCGLTVKCNDHRLVKFEVKKGKTVNSISICDWYGALVPKEK